MIEEYARHNGHAGLIREQIGSVTGEDRPPAAWGGVSWAAWAG